jgi:hypothetical protein
MNFNMVGISSGPRVQKARMGRGFGELPAARLPETRPMIKGPPGSIDSKRNIGPK